MGWIGPKAPRNDHRTTASDSSARGQAIVEFAVLAPIMLLMLLMAVDFGRLFYSYVSVHNAAREATFVAAHRASDTAMDAEAFAAVVAQAAQRESNAQSQAGAGAVTVSAPTCFEPDTNAAVDCHEAAQFAGGSGKRVTVSVSQSFDFLTPLVTNLFGGELILTAAATGPVLNPLDVTIVAAPAPSSSPLATLTPTPSPTPSNTPEDDEETPSAEPMCTVPDFYHTYWNDIGSLTVWHDEAGFSGMLTDATGGKKIQTQTLEAGDLVPCSSDMTVSNN